MDTREIIPPGLCQCGCGQVAPIARQTDTKRRYIRGEPKRFIHGHGPRKRERYRVDPETGCWNWLLALVNGYPRVGVNRKQQSAHRVMYEQHVGPIPDGLVIDHLCRNPACVNPAHLEPVTQAENVRRGELPKLTAELVREIRARVRAGERRRALAEEMDVSTATIDEVVRRRYWRDI